MVLALKYGGDERFGIIYILEQHVKNIDVDLSENLAEPSLDHAASAADGVDSQPQVLHVVQRVENTEDVHPTRNRPRLDVQTALLETHGDN